jgi:hypothetical protein
LNNDVVATIKLFGPFDQNRITHVKRLNFESKFTLVFTLLIVQPQTELDDCDGEI